MPESKDLGDTIRQALSRELPADSEVVRALTLTLSDEAQKKIEAIESNIRAAEQRSGMIPFR